MQQWRVTLNGWQRPDAKPFDRDRSIWTVQAAHMNYTEHGDLVFLDAEGRPFRGFAHGMWLTFVCDGPAVVEEDALPEEEYVLAGGADGKGK